ncbi:MAG: LytTR family DNA-binding domain-containing protein [Alistipes sp.]|nr:LytTR family DNA-binding domain-containing protein [Alistipes sp.]
MIRIAVCDGDELFRASLKGYIGKYLSERNVEQDMDFFASGEELLDLGIELARYDIVFLEITGKKKNGIETAMRIRECRSDIYIAAMADSMKYSTDGYRADIIRYLLKNGSDFEELVRECLRAVFEKMSRVTPGIKLPFRECEKDVLVERIFYVESRLHTLEFYIMEESIKKYTMYGTLNALEQDMREFHFVRIHQSYLVNLRHIRNVSAYKVILNNDQELKIPKTRYKAVKQAFLEYRGEI